MALHIVHEYDWDILVLFIAYSVSNNYAAVNYANPQLAPT